MTRKEDEGRLITCWPTVYRPADGRRVAFGALLERVKSPRWYARKDEVGRWSPATFRNDYRNRASFLTEAAIVTDIGDNGAVPRAELEQLLSGRLGFAYSTWSSTPSAQRWRLVLILSRPIDADEHDRVWRYVASLEERGGIHPDFASKGAPHPWALPARHDGDHYECFDLAGEPLDVDTALEMFPNPEPLPPVELEPDDSIDRRLERASKYLATMPGAIAGSHGSTATFRAAVTLVRGFALPAADALRLLVQEFNPRCAPPWSEHELRHKVRQAFQRAKMPFGVIAERSKRRAA